MCCKKVVEDAGFKMTDIASVTVFVTSIDDAKDERGLQIAHPISQTGTSHGTSRGLTQRGAPVNSKTHSYQMLGDSVRALTLFYRASHRSKRYSLCGPATHGSQQGVGDPVGYNRSLT
jgi:hypothetical protein